MPRGYRKNGTHLGFQKGHNVTEETRQKIRLGHIGKKPNSITCKKMSLAHLGKPNNRLGKKHSKETRKKLSLSRVGKKGDRASNWKEGITQEKNYKRNFNREYRRKRGKQYIQFYNNKRKLLTSDLTLKTIQTVYEDNIKQFGTLTCYLCLSPIQFKQDCLEHKIPLSRGGDNKYSNLAIAHRNCNSRKYNKTEEEYKTERKK